MRSTQWIGVRWQSLVRDASAFRHPLDAEARHNLNLRHWGAMRRCSGEVALRGGRCRGQQRSLTDGGGTAWPRSMALGEQEEGRVWLCVVARWL
jgi:hypothetical protein